MTTNRIITRGMGKSRVKTGNAGLITQGYGGTILQKIKEQITRVIHAGRSAGERVIQEVQDVIVWAKLIRVNDKTPIKNISGHVRVRNRASSVAIKIMERISVRTRNALEDIKITIRRIR